MADTESEGADLRSSTESIRQTTKWIAAAFGGLGAVLVAGIQLRDVTGDDVTAVETILALVGVAIALIGVGTVIHAASSVLVAHFATLSQINHARAMAVLGPAAVPASEVVVPAWLLDDVVAAILGSWSTLVDAPFNDLREVEDAHSWTTDAYLALAIEQTTFDDPFGRTWTPNDVERLETLRGRLRESSRRVVAFANDVVTRYLYRGRAPVPGQGRRSRVRESLRAFRGRTLVSTVAVVVGVALFTAMTRGDTGNVRREPDQDVDRSASRWLEDPEDRKTDEGMMALPSIAGREEATGNGSSLRRS